MYLLFKQQTRTQKIHSDKLSTKCHEKDILLKDFFSIKSTLAPFAKSNLYLYIKQIKLQKLCYKTGER